MTILKVGACRSFHRVVGAREGHDVRLGGCWGVVGGVLGGCWGAVGCMLGGPGASTGAQAPKGGMLGYDADILRLYPQDIRIITQHTSIRCGYLAPRTEADGRRYPQMARQGFNITPVASFSINVCVLGGLEVSKNSDFTMEKCKC